MYQGSVCSVRLDRGFFFIAAPGMDDIFGHVRDLPESISFDETLKGRRVSFELCEDAGRGPRATSIKPAE